MSTLRDARRGRRVLVMAGVAGVLSVMAVLANMGGATAPRSERTGKPVLPDFAAKRAEATGIRVILADESYMLVATGEGWKLGARTGWQSWPKALKASPGMFRARKTRRS
jgi:hypothetical protein